jgi:uncharacterized membrane protein (UPF0127 family)
MTPTQALRALALAAFFSSAAASVGAQQAAQKLPSVRLSAGIYRIDAELAQTPEQRTIGLMFRPSMGVNDGMLFVFEEAAQQCFWMKNTLIPLAIAFIGDDGRIVNIDRMLPQTLDPHCSTRPVRFVLEMNEGWFERRGVKPGAQLRGAPFGN